MPKKVDAEIDAAITPDQQGAQDVQNVPKPIPKIPEKQPTIAMKAAGEIIFLINHIAREGKPVDQKVYESALESSRKILDGSASIIEEATFWKIYATLTNEAAPARVEALHYRDFLDADKAALGPNDNVAGMRRHNRILTAIRWISIASFFVCLIFLAYLSIAESTIERNKAMADEHSNLVVYIAKGTAVEKAFNSITQGDYLWLDSEQEADRSGKSEKQSTTAASSDAKKREDNRREQQKTVIDGRRREVESLVGFNDRLLRKLQFDISSLFDASKSPVAQASPMDAAVLSVQQSINSLISKYLLPVFASLLGVTVFILRSESDDMKNLSLRTFESSSYSNRLALGVVGGLAISWFTISDATGVIGSITPAALAFLVGYSVEVLYNVLDALVQALGGRKKATT